MSSKVCVGKYEVQQKIGEGSFGQIYIGKNKYTNEEVAIKLEDKDGKNLLHREAKIYNILKDLNCIPKIRNYGKEGVISYLIMDLLGKSLEDLMDLKGNLSVYYVAQIGTQLIAGLKQIHSYGLLHRDVKPDNFLLNKQNNMDKLYIIDFGLSKSYLMKDGSHIAFNDDKNLVGTARYASINVHNGVETSRRDDLESLGYMLIYLLKGRLPWQGLKAITKNEKYKKIKEIKETCKLSKLCENIPMEYHIYLEYCRKLEFSEKPNYEYLKGLFTNQLLLYNTIKIA